MGCRNLPLALICLCDLEYPQNLSINNRSSSCVVAIAAMQYYGLIPDRDKIFIHSTKRPDRFGATGFAEKLPNAYETTRCHNQDQ
jgi:hypothetical protein